MNDIAELIRELAEQRETLTRKLHMAEAEAEKQRDNAEHWKARYEDSKRSGESDE